MAVSPTSPFRDTIIPAFAPQDPRLPAGTSAADLLGTSSGVDPAALAVAADTRLPELGKVEAKMAPAKPGGGPPAQSGFQQRLDSPGGARAVGAIQGGASGVGGQSTAQSSLGGASAGAGIGFMIGGPVGAGIGAVVGGIAGALTADGGPGMTWGDRVNRDSVRRTKFFRKLMGNIFNTNSQGGAL